MTVQLCLRVCTMAAVLVLAARCSEPRDSIVIDEGKLAVENQTGSDWKNVRITVNDHFTAGVPLLAAGQRMDAQLSQFQTGLGHRYDRTRMSVFKVEVSATDESGAPVTIVWGGSRR